MVGSEKSILIQREMQNIKRKAVLEKYKPKDTSVKIFDTIVAAIQTKNRWRNKRKDEDDKRQVFFL